MWTLTSLTWFIILYVTTYWLWMYYLRQMFQPGKCSIKYSKGWTGCHFRTECHINAAWWCLKLKHNLVPSNMQTFTPVTVMHDNNTRSAARGDFFVSIANLKYYTRSFQYEGTRLWNNISGSIQQSTSIPVFKSSCMKNYFTQ